MSVKNCPFCKASTSDKIEIDGVNCVAVAIHSYETAVCVQCESCGTYGPLRKTAKEAIDAWNTRAATPPSFEPFKGPFEFSPTSDFIRDSEGSTVALIAITLCEADKNRIGTQLAALMNGEAFNCSKCADLRESLAALSKACRDRLPQGQLEKLTDELTEAGRLL